VFSGLSSSRIGILDENYVSIVKAEVCGEESMGLCRYITMEVSVGHAAYCFEVHSPYLMAKFADEAA
jgi:hypothetical protein